MGYPNLSAGPSLSAGVPIDTPYMTLLQRAFTLLLPQAEPLVLSIVERCNFYDERIVEAADRMQIQSADGITMRADETDALEREYMRQVGRLSDTIGCSIYPFSERFKSMPSSKGVQVGMIARVA
jgi:hypothetical protein